MARIEYAPEIQGIRGSAAGLTFSANAAGPYVKRYAITTNRNTPLQATAKLQHTQSALAWRTISEANRALWDAFALDPPEADYDPFGNPRFLTGFQWFARINTRRTRAGSALLEAPPTSTPADPVDILLLEVLQDDPPDPSAILAFENNTFSDGSLPVITATFSTKPPPGAPTTGYRQCWLAAPTASNYVQFGTQLAALFGIYRPGWYCTATLRRQATSGIRSTQTTATALVAVP